MINKLPDDEKVYPMTPLERCESNIGEAERSVVYWRNRLESLHRERDRLRVSESESLTKESER